MIRWLMVLTALASSSQESARGSVDFGRLASFVGSWEGRESGRAGDGVGDRTCELVLGDNFLFCDNTSTFPPQERNPEGEVHRDWTMFSYDGLRARFVARQFNIETFVNHLVLDADASDEDRLVFVSESSENAPEGTRVRLAYRFQGTDHFEETFEIAWPGKDFEIYLTNLWSRAPGKR